MNIEHTRPRHAAPASLLGGLVALARALLKVALGLLGLVVLLGALMLGLLLALGIVIWARLRGRTVAPGVFRAAYARARRRSMPAAGEVVDVEVREVPDRAGSSNRH